MQPNNLVLGLVLLAFSILFLFLGKKFLKENSKLDSAYSFAAGFTLLLLSLIAIIIYFSNLQ